MDVVQQINLGRDISHWMPSVVSRGAAVGAHPSVRKLTYHIASACATQLREDDFKKIRSAALRDLTPPAEPPPSTATPPADAKPSPKGKSPKPTSVPTDCVIYALRFLKALPEARLLDVFGDGTVLRSAAAHQNYKVREEVAEVLCAMASGAEPLYEVGPSLHPALVGAFLSRYQAILVDAVQDPVDSVSSAAFSVLKALLCTVDGGHHSVAAAPFAPYFLRFLGRAAELNAHYRAAALRPLTALCLAQKGVPVVLSATEVVRGVLRGNLGHAEVPSLVVEAARCIMLVAEVEPDAVDSEVTWQVADRLICLLESSVGVGAPVSPGSSYIEGIVLQVLALLPKLPPHAALPFCLRLLALAAGFSAERGLLSLRTMLLTTTVDHLLTTSLNFAAQRLACGDPLHPATLYSEIRRLREHTFWRKSRKWAKGQNDEDTEGGGTTSPELASLHDEIVYALCSGVLRLYSNVVVKAREAEAEFARLPFAEKQQRNEETGDVKELCFTDANTGVQYVSSKAGNESAKSCVLLAAWCGLGLQVCDLCIPHLKITEKRGETSKPDHTDRQHVAAFHQTLRLALKLHSAGISALLVSTQFTRYNDPTRVFSNNREDWLAVLMASARGVTKGLAVVALDTTVIARHRNVTKVLILCTVATLLFRLIDLPHGEPCITVDTVTTSDTQNSPQRTASTATQRRGSVLSGAIPNEDLERLVAITLAKACQKYLVSGERETMSLALFDALLSFGAVRGSESPGGYWEKSERVVEMVLRDASRSATAPQTLMVVKHKLDNVRTMMQEAVAENGHDNAALTPAQLALCGVTPFSGDHPAFYHDATAGDMALVTSAYEAELRGRGGGGVSVQRPRAHTALVTAPDDPLTVLASYRWEGPDTVICLSITNPLPLTLKRLKVTVGCRGDMVSLHHPQLSVYKVSAGGGAKGKVEVCSRSDIIPKVLFFQSADFCFSRKARALPSCTLSITQNTAFQILPHRTAVPRRDSRDRAHLRHRDADPGHGVHDHSRPAAFSTYRRTRYGRHL